MADATRRRRIARMMRIEKAKWIKTKGGDDVIEIRRTRYRQEFHTTEYTRIIKVDDSLGVY